MTTPTILPDRASRYLDVRQLVAEASRPPESAGAPAPASVVLPTRSERILRVLRAATTPVTSLVIAERLGCTPANVIEWLRRHGPRHGVVCVGVEDKPNGMKGSNLWVIERGAG